MTKTWTIDEVENKVFDIVKNEKQLDDSFTKTTPLESIGLDSLALVRILVSIDQNLGVWLEGGALEPENLEDVKHLAACVNQSMHTTA